MLNTLKLIVFAAFAIIVMVYYWGITLADIKGYAYVALICCILMAIFGTLKSPKIGIWCAALILPLALVVYKL